MAAYRRYSSGSSQLDGGDSLRFAKVSRRRFVIIGSVAALATAVGNAVCATPGWASGVVDATVGGLQDRAQELVADAEELMDALGSMDFAAAQEKAYAVRDAAVELQGELSGGLWSVAQIVPVYGGDVKGARTLVDMLVDLSNDALVPLCEALAANPPDTLLTTWEGSIDVKLDPLQSIIDAALAALESLRANLAVLDGVGDFHVAELSDIVGQVCSAVEPYRDKLDTVEDLLTRLPRFIGSEGVRRYMVVAQTNCEIRSTGGFPGAIGLITADRGTITMNGFSSMYDYMPRNTGLNLAITDEERALFGDDISWYAGIMNTIPHFPRVCELWTQACAIESGLSVDGIVAVDPVFLQNLLALYGSVTTSDGTLIDGTNAAQVLMSDVYWRFVDDNTLQDEFFSEAAQLVFSYITSNLLQCDVSLLVSKIHDAINSRRLTVWMADSEEQPLLAAFGCTGEVNQDPVRPRAGIYLANNTWGKIDWWLDTQITFKPAESSDIQDLTHLPKKEIMGQVGGNGHVTYMLTNSLSWEDVTKNDYVFGGSPQRRCDGDMVLMVWIYAPCGGEISNVKAAPTESGFSAIFTERSHMGLQVVFSMIQLLPGESLTIEYDVTCSDEAEEPLVFDVTPICHD